MLNISGKLSDKIKISNLSRSTFSGKSWITLPLKRYPKNFHSLCPKIHYDGLITTPYSRKRAKSNFKCSLCFFSDADALKMSSIYAKQESKPRRTSSMNRWNVWAAFRNPNVIKGNSNNPNGVVMAVLQMSSAATGIWWNALIRSITENNFFSSKVVSKISYMSHRVTVRFCYWIQATVVSTLPRALGPCVVTMTMLPSMPLRNRALRTC